MQNRSLLIRYTAGLYIQIKTAAILCGAALIYLFLFSVSSYASTLVQRSIGDASRINPIFATDSASGEISGWIFNGLLKYNANLKLTGDLAKKYLVSKDGKTVTFILRKGIKWQDGVEFTSADPLFTYRALKNPEVATPYSTDFMLIDKAEAIGKYIFRVHYKTVFVPALASWTMGILPYHLLKGHNLATDRFNRHPIGTGPYKLTKWKSGQSILLTKNNNYFRGAPRIDHLLYKIIPDSATAFLQLETGKIDAMGLSPIQLKRQITEKIKENYKIYINPSFGYTYLGLNLRRKLFQNKKVRKALNYAINKKQIIDTILFGEGTVSNGIYPPTSWVYDSSVRASKYNLPKAERLLKETGYIYKDGKLIKDGKQFSFTVVTNQGNNERKYAALLIQSDLKKIGIKMNIRILEWQAFLNLVNSRNFDAVLLGWQLSPDPDQFSIWDSSQDKPGGFNFVGYHNKTVDKLLERGRKTMDRKQRKIIYQKINKIIFNDKPYLFLYSPYSIVVIQKRFKGIKKEKAGIFYHLVDWYVPKRLEIYP
ncbi:MAG: peptide-binding protein [Epsilonproteobacteria bacterium]|nr:peptide-binding protein [Campylobacterota bacterium]